MPEMFEVFTIQTSGAIKQLNKRSDQAIKY